MTLVADIPKTKNRIQKYWAASSGGGRSRMAAGTQNETLELDFGALGKFLRWSAASKFTSEEFEFVSQVRRTLDAGWTLAAIGGMHRTLAAYGYKTLGEAIDEDERFVHECVEECLYSIAVPNVISWGELEVWIAIAQRENPQSPHDIDLKSGATEISTVLVDGIEWIESIMPGISKMLDTGYDHLSDDDLRKVSELKGSAERLHRLLNHEKKALDWRAERGRADSARPGR